MHLASPSLALTLRLLAAPAAALLLPACSGGEDDTGATSTTDPATTGATTQSSTAPTGSTTAPTTAPTSTSEPGTTSEPATSEPATDTLPGTDTGTTEEPTSDTGGSDDTGPICEPGTANCVCLEGLCNDGSTCEAGVCVMGMLCPGDVATPGADEDDPVDLGDITDDDDDFFEEMGVLSGASDVDWYRWHGADTFGHTAEPTVMLTAGMPRTCMFLVCDEGGAAVTAIECPAGTDFAISPKLRPGCCGAASFTIKDFGCPGQDESMDMWLRLDKPPTDSCTDYAFKIHF